MTVTPNPLHLRQRCDKVCQTGKCDHRHTDDIITTLIHLNVCECVCVLCVGDRFFFTFACTQIAYANGVNCNVHNEGFQFSHFTAHDNKYKRVSQYLPTNQNCELHAKQGYQKKTSGNDKLLECWRFEGLRLSYNIHAIYISKSDQINALQTHSF